MNVPLLDLQAQLKTLEQELIDAVTDVVRSTRYVGGAEVEGLEHEIAEYCGTASGVGVSSGTDALLVALMGLGVGPGNAVLTTPYSFFATMGVILRLGARPVFADIDPVSYNIDPVKMAEVLEADSKKEIKAIIPVHLYGQCADMQAIMQLAAQYDLPVIEDAAQAIGSEYPMSDGSRIRMMKAGSMGLAGCFSFFPSKNLGGIGDGGMVVTRDEEFARDIACLRNHGARPKYYHRLVGGNFRLDAIQAAALRVKLRYLNKWHEGRARNAARYNAFFAATTLLENGVVQLPAAVYRNHDGEAVSGSHIYNQYVLRVRDRDGLRAHLSEYNVGCEVYYPVPLHKQECLGAAAAQWHMPEAEKAAEQTLALPVYPELTEEMQAYVVDVIKKYYQ